MDPLSALSSLGDATRRRVYDHVAAQPAPLSREEVAAAAGIGRTLAAYHLDRLAAEGLLAVTYERRSGRSGPGAGRPAKLYARAGGELNISLPPRDYQLAARLLADAAAADAPGGAVRRALAAAAERLGGEVAVPEAADLEAALRERGYEPYARRRRVAAAQLPVPRGRPAPSRRGVRHEPGAAARPAPPGTEVALEPAPGRCCVALRTGRSARA